MKKHSCFTVLGKPFFSIGAQLHNSGGYALGAEAGEKYEKDTVFAFESLKKLGVNTVAVPVCWDIFEPTEGCFDYMQVQRIIDKVREKELHLILLWFGSWKNGQMEYTPNWIKQDKKRFPRCQCKDGDITTVLSPFYSQNKEQDKQAFCRLVEFVKEYDEKIGTVIGIQVENEPGMYAASIRDFSEKGTEAFLGEVPEDLIEAIQKEQGEIYCAWVANGKRTSGNWETVFGRYGAEMCMAWATAKYIDDIAYAGKQIYDIFMYVNVWMDRNNKYGWSMAGLDYPSGGAVSKVLPVWFAACNALDAIAPDIYETFPDCVIETQNKYDRKDWAFYVPESGQTNLNATMMFEAVGNHKAIGYHVFAAESCMDDNGDIVENAIGIQHSFQMLQNAKDLIEQYIGTENIYTLTQHIGQDGAHLEVGNWICRIS